MRYVYLVHHLNLLPSGQEDVKVIGVYSSKREAIKTIKRINKLPGFSSHPKIIDPFLDDDGQGFYMDRYELNKDNWSEGFITITADGKEYNE